MTTLANFNRVRAAINRGAWIPVNIPGLEGVSLNVRGLGNADYNRIYGELAQALDPSERDADGSPNETAHDRIVDQCIKEAVLLGWKGIDDPFTPEAVAGVLAHPDGGPTFRNAVIAAAATVAKQEKAAIEADAKN